MSEKGAQVIYPNGQKAFSFLCDGSGFAYYPSGRPCICVSTVSTYQNRFFFYDDAPTPVTPKLSEVAAGKLKEHLLCALDEYFIGYAVDKSKGKMSGTRCVFTKTGALIANSDGVIESQWKWDRSSQNAGVPPSSTLVLKLNDCLTLTFNDRSNASVHFSCEGIVKDIDVGMKVRRTSNYLDNAEKEISGRLVLNMPHTTLAQRQEEFSMAMKTKRDILNPRSENLGESVRFIVKGLEDNFDDYADTHSTTRYLEPSWKSESLSRTRSELPCIPLAGTESGPSKGFGDSLYITPESFAASQSGLDSPTFQSDGIPDHLRDPKTNGFKNNFEISNTLRDHNPMLPRSQALKISSGRYSSDLPIPGGRVTSKNPTGMSECRRRPLEVIKANDLPDLVQRSASQLLVVFCVREDDSACRRAVGVAESVNGMLAARGTASLGINVDDILTFPPHNQLSGVYDESRSECRLVRVDMSESRTVADKYKVRTAPFILFFYGGRTVYGGTLGGSALKVGGGIRQLKILLVEPNFSDQMKTEGVLTKQRHLGSFHHSNTYFVCFYVFCLSLYLSIKTQDIIEKPIKGPTRLSLISPSHYLLTNVCVITPACHFFLTYRRLSWDLVMSGTEAVLRSQACLNGEPYDIVMLSEACTQEDASVIDRVFKDAKGGGPLIVGLASVYGDSVGSYARLSTVSWEVPNLFCRDAQSKRALMASDRHAAAVHIVCTKPLKTAHIECIYDLVKERNRKLGESDKDDRSVGMTQRALVTSLIRYLGEGRRGEFIGGDLASLGTSAKELGSTLPGQETTYFGTTLNKAAMRQTSNQMQTQIVP